MSAFHITVKTAHGVERYYALAISAHAACMHAIAAQGDEPCGVAARPL